MDRTEFIKIMKKKHVPNFYYNIEGTGRDDERFYLNKDEHGMYITLKEVAKLQINILIVKVKH